MVKQRLNKEFPNIKIQSERPDRAIAFGAAIYAANTNDLFMAAPHTYGVNCHNPSQNKSMIDNILFKDTPISVHPDCKYISDKQNYSPKTPGQTSIACIVYESDEPRGVEWLDYGNYKPMFKTSYDIEKIKGIKTINRSFTTEIRLLQGGILELHVYDNDQNGKEVAFKIHRL